MLLCSPPLRLYWGNRGAVGEVPLGDLMKHSILICLAALLLAALSPCLPSAAQGVSGGKLPTRWDAQVSATAPLPEYPRPQMTRENWQSLNGSWEYGLTESAATTPPAEYTGKILVPYPMESALSGVAHPSAPDQRLWYRRTFAIPAAWKGQQRPAALRGCQLGQHSGCQWSANRNASGRL